MGIASACRAKVAATNQLKALIVAAPEEPRAELRGLETKRQIARCAEAALLRAELERLVAAMAPWLLELPGVGPISAAQVLVSWSHAGRVRSEAAFAALAGVNPIPASSGQVIRHRRNRGGDRQLNRALHTISCNTATARGWRSSPSADAVGGTGHRRFPRLESG